MVANIRYWGSMSLYYAIGATVPVSYVLGTVAPVCVRYLAAAGISCSLLAFPLQEVGKRTPTAMMTAVAAFCAALKTSSMLVFGRRAGEPQSKHLTFAGFSAWAKEYLWFLFPATPDKPVAQSWWKTTLTSLSSLGWALAKILLLPTVHHALVTNCPMDASIPKPIARLSFIWAIQVCLGTWTLDIQDAIANLFSFGRYRVTYNNYVVLSDSICDFWSRRYNVFIRTFLHETVFLPARKVLKLSANASVLATFTMSGLLHSYVAYVTFGHGILRSFTFFLVHGLACLADNYAAQKYRIPTILRGALVPLLLGLTQPLYPALFIEAMPDWLNASRPTTPQFLVPLATRITRAFYQ